MLRDRLTFAVALGVPILKFVVSIPPQFSRRLVGAIVVDSNARRSDWPAG